jgi:hypothetical protein
MTNTRFLIIRKPSGSSDKDRSRIAESGHVLDKVMLGLSEKIVSEGRVIWKVLIIVINA